MQYGVDIAEFKRVDTKKSRREIRIQDTFVKSIISGCMALLLSRVMLVVIPGVGIAPFGLAYLLGESFKENRKYSILTLLGAILGYLSIYKALDGVAVYIMSAVLIFAYSRVKSFLKYEQKDKAAFLLIFGAFFIYSLIINKQPVGVNLTFSLIKVISIAPVYYILKYALNCTEELKTNYIFSTEELISIGILVCLLVSGVGQIGIWGISIRNIVALASVIVIAYVGGSGLGAAIGVTMGFIVGITTDNIVALISLYSVCGLIVGIFKDTGRIFSAISYVVIYFIISMYSETFAIYGAIEAVIAAIVLIILPNGLVSRFIKEVNQDKKVEIINDIHLQGIKSEFASRLEALKGVLSDLSISISNLAENDRLLLNNKGTAMVESLADRVCCNCEMRGRCWDRNLHNTFNSFSDLISSCEANEMKFPSDLEKRCVKKSALLRSSQELINNYVVNEALKTRLSEGRNLISNHINNMALTMGDIVRDFNKDISVCTDIDRLLRKTLNKNSVEYKDVFCYLDRKGRLKIKVTLSNCEGANYCSKKVLPIINSLVKIPVSIGREGCRINPDTDECSIIIEETPKYHVLSYVATDIKDGERFAGDSYSYGKNDDGTYLTIVSDGMGSGPEAGTESKVAVDLIEKFIEAGFSDKTAINTVNSIMAMKFSEDEKFTTLDLNLIDLYTGEADFMKVGGVVSFIKRGNEVEVINSESLPFGVLDSVDVSAEKKKLKHGDIIVTISDGVLDVDKSDVGNYEWLREYIEYADTNPEALSRDILEKSKSLSGGRIRDDMTVLVSKIYSVY
ncbi:stage II sporulation protein E [Clostridium septicum]|uniref:Stage II sporulation protein E n=1 Tax=Clostridium septicum TaxID=1504 RepID=A0A9N7PJ83_CLOSE|nr:stage II sporulation protein E [Clostridium septicum]AYE34481.1 stage II sporulation protein E [Clostridium septicum]MDU1315004.1 stage II sporulation protein E [Clostridium septicum]QAS59883.1 stage II sporulation protein E [Clostridium septicum]UEC20877.1 stage II sporulation protein E [Clostridium septicum]USS01073.1 stage II sporulation protein E [Clostridium septicum]